MSNKEWKSHSINNIISSRSRRSNTFSQINREVPTKIRFDQNTLQNGSHLHETIRRRLRNYRIYSAQEVYNTSNINHRLSIKKVQMVVAAAYKNIIIISWEWCLICDTRYPLLNTSPIIHHIHPSQYDVTMSDHLIPPMEPCPTMI